MSILALALGLAAALQVETAPAPRTVEVIPRRHALIICGHPGDAPHAKSFAEIVRKICDGLERTAGIPRERQHIVFGADAPKDLPGATGPATKEAILAAVADVIKEVCPNDGLWVITLGHGHYDG